MTFERKIVFSLSEIKAVVFQCTSCEAKITLPLEKIEAPPNQCPSGHRWEWNVATGYRASDSPFKAFLAALGKLRDPLCEQMGFRILLEIDQISE